MEERKVISGATEAEVWPLVKADLNTGEDLLYYDALINQGDKQIRLYIDIDLGGGFESGSEITTISAPLAITPAFKFAVHDEDFLDTIGKFFGLEDVKTGYPDLDEHVVIKTNHEEKARQLFADAEVRSVFATLEDFDFGIHNREIEDSDQEQPYLELNINRGLVEPDELYKIYHTFCKVFEALQE